ncbi:hypothetical protein N9I25_09035 [Hellea sp.]|nr:hypothetical protein [Hellea sp.]
MGHKDMNIKFKTIIVTLLTFSLTGCWMSKEQKREIASVTCSIIKEIPQTDTVARLEKINEARIELGAKPYLDGGKKLIEVLEVNQCLNLVLGTEESLERVNKAIFRKAHELNNRIYRYNKYEDMSTSYDVSALQDYVNTYPDYPDLGFSPSLPMTNFGPMITERIKLIKQGMSGSTNGLFIQEELEKQFEKSVGFKLKYLFTPDIFSPNKRIKYNVITMDVDNTLLSSCYLSYNNDRCAEEVIYSVLGVIEKLGAYHALTISVEFNGTQTKGVYKGKPPYSSIALNRLFDRAVNIAKFDKQLIVKKTRNTVEPSFYGKEDGILEGKIKDTNASIVIKVFSNKQ